MIEATIASDMNKLADILRCPLCGDENFDFGSAVENEGLLEGRLACQGCSRIFEFDRGVLLLVDNQDSVLSSIDARNQVVFPETWIIAPEDYNSVKYTDEFSVFSRYDSMFDGTTYLDAGCGSGRLMEKWADYGCQTIVFVDVSDSIYLAVERYKKHFQGRFDAIFLRADIKNLPLKDGCIDNSASNAVIHHTTDQDVAVKEILRVTRERFTLAVVTEKTLIGKIWISFNIFGPIINRINAPKTFLWMATLMAYGASLIIHFLHYSGIARLTSAGDTFANLVSDRNNFAKLRYNMLDLLTSPFYVKHPDRYYIDAAAEKSFGLVYQETTSDKDYYFFQSEQQ